MIFGPTVRAAPTTEPADWIVGRRLGEWGTVGSLVPGDYATYLEVDAPHEGERWSEEYRELFGAIASVGVGRTRTSSTCWFAVWEGHGFDSGASFYFAQDGKRDRKAERALRAESEARNARIRAALDDVTRIDLPHRTYFLLGGDGSAATELRWAGEDRWFRPDLWWPDDRAWFVATDVDFFRLYLGGDEAFIGAVADAVRTGSRPVPLDHRLEAD